MRKDIKERALKGSFVEKNHELIDLVNNLKITNNNYLYKINEISVNDTFICALSDADNLEQMFYLITKKEL